MHIWTVDRHLIETAVRASELARRAGRPDLLLVSALLHDIGKGWPGDHSVACEIIARDVAARIGFDRADVAVLATLVRHHLLLIDTATRRDLAGPGDRPLGRRGRRIRQSTLELLHALTEADALATGPAAWSSWCISSPTWSNGSPPCSPETPPRSPRPPRPRPSRSGSPSRRSAPEAPYGTALRAKTEPPTEEEPTGDPSPWRGNPPIAVPDQPGVLPAVAGVLAMHRLTVRTAELRALDLPDGVEGSVLLLNWRVAAEYGSLPQAARLRADLVRSLDVLGIAADPPSATPPIRAAGALIALTLGDWSPPPPPATRRSSRSAPTTLPACCTASGGPWRTRAYGCVACTSTLGANAVDAFYVTGPKGRAPAGGRGGGFGGAWAGGDAAA